MIRQKWCIVQLSLYDYFGEVAEIFGEKMDYQFDKEEGKRVREFIESRYEKFTVIYKIKIEDSLLFDQNKNVSYEVNHSESSVKDSLPQSKNNATPNTLE